MNQLDLINIGPDAPDLLPSTYEKCFAIDEADLILGLRRKFSNESSISVEDASKCFIALYVWQNVRNVAAPTDGSGQATMRNLAEYLSVFGFDDSQVDVREIVSIAERNHWVTRDWGPSEMQDAKSDDAHYSYLDPGGFEAGAAIVASLVDEIRFERERQIPAADRIVDLSDNQSGVRQAIEKVERSIDVIEASNTLHSEEKDLWVDLLRQGELWLRKPQTYIAAISALLLKPLYDAYSSVLEDSAKPIIQAAVDAVKALIGL